MLIWSAAGLNRRRMPTRSGLPLTPAARVPWVDGKYYRFPQELARRVGSMHGGVCAHLKGTDDAEADREASLLSAWSHFLACSALIAIAGFWLARYGDAIAEKTGLGGTWIGVILVATDTSLPELATGVSSVTLADAPNIAVGDVLESCVLTLALIAEFKKLMLIKARGPIIGSLEPKRQQARHSLCACGRINGSAAAMTIVRCGAHGNRSVRAEMMGLFSRVAIAGSFAVLMAGTIAPAQAQAPDDPSAALRPGEAFVTRFSGTTLGTAPGGTAMIDLAGKVGSVIDLRNPGQPPQGQHWIDEPQRHFVTAGEVGQVFGVALDDANPPNIYLAATSAFGLHLAPGARNWMAGMWGPGYGPGTIYMLEAGNGYKPRAFATIGVDSRPNSGAALGNITYDRFNRQLLVSDMESGMIHRIRASDGADLGYFDHGTQGRAAFTDAQSGQVANLPPIPFNPQSAARIGDCPAGPFERSPQCWNYAPSGRRVWGVGTRRDPQSGAVRLYYSVWSGPAFGDRGWQGAPEDDKRVSVWSVGLDQSGGFDPRSVRREFQLPDFFTSGADIARAGYSHPVSDITFSQCGERPVMLIAERGGVRNLGLAAENAFAYPHEARALRYELDQSSVWRPIGRYDVGFYDRKENGAPFMRANCAGGIDFGQGFDAKSGTLQPERADASVWITGDALCSPNAPCNMPGMAEAVASGEKGGDGAQPGAEPASLTQQPSDGAPDDSHVHGVQGNDADAFAELLPGPALGAYPAEGEATSSSAMERTYLIDTDINIDENGGLIEEALLRNDATRIGDIAIYQPCAPRPIGTAIPAAALLPLPTGAPPTLVDHPTDVSHARIASHGTVSSHNRYGSHNPYWSHNRWRSHSLEWSHSRDGSHDLFLSHNRWSSHRRVESHSRLRSHSRALSHWQVGSHSTRWSHQRYRSHSQAGSHGARSSHNQRISHARLRSHNATLSHTRLHSHARTLSHARTASHTSSASHARARSHGTSISHNRAGSHVRSRSHGITGSHNRVVSHGRSGSHNTVASGGSTHHLSRSHQRAASGHSTAVSTRPHGTALSHTRHRSHNPAVSAGRHTKGGPQLGIIGKGTHLRAMSLRDTKRVPPRVTAPPQVKQPPRVTLPPRVKQPPRVTVPPRVKQTPRTLPTTRQTPRVRQVPQVRQTPRVRQVPRVRQTPQVRQTPRVRQAPQVRQAPRVRQTPRVRQVPQVRRAPVVRKQPEKQR